MKITTIGEIADQCPEASFEGMELQFTKEEGKFAVYLRGYYTIEEMRAITRELCEANKFADRF
ncbi:hypothetical protein ACODYM_29100 [Burkholderia gladioli]|uniref:hypothetical protein n=1 Tax=Burkholderia gladioli TaxID=28095 RepID=UPI003B50DC42